MTPGVLDRWGEPLDTPEDDNTLDPTSRRALPTRKARIAELRKILKDARARRETDQ